MNTYGQLAKNHWQKHNPSQYETIQNPEEFFSSLGLEIETRIQQVAEALAGPNTPGEGYLAKVGRLNMARLQAEEQILHEMVYSAATSDDPDQNLQDSDLDLVSDVQNAIDQARREALEQETNQQG